MNSKRIIKSALVICGTLITIFTSSVHSIKAIGWDDDFNGQFGNDTIVRFGLYSYEDMGITLSQPDYFFDHIKYGLSHSIYNYYRTMYGDNANFPSEVSIIYQRLEDIFGRDFFTLLSEQRFLLNAYVIGNNVFMMFNRVPEVNSVPIFEKTLNENNGYKLEFLPYGYKTSFYFYDFSDGSHRLASMCPYYVNNNLSIGNQYSNIQSALTSFTNLEDIKSAIINQNVRSFTIQLGVTVPSITFTPYFTRYYAAYYDSYTFKAFSYSTSAKPICIMSDFPVYTSNNKGFILQDTSYFMLLYNKLGTFYIDEEMSPIIISGYEDIPQVTPTPTFTPTPIPTWTPFPTATPFPPVNEIEGISQMMTLFTRKYEFNINGNVIGIRPLYLFVFTFLVGAIFKAIQGGDRN